MFLLRQCQLFGRLLSVALLSLIFTLIFQAVYGIEANIQHSQRKELEEMVNATSEIPNRNFKNDPGIESLNYSTNDQYIRKASMSDSELTASRNLTNFGKDNVDCEFYKNLENIDSTNSLNNLVTNIGEEKDVICWYRKATNDNVLRETEDWQKLLDIIEGFKVYSVHKRNSKYIICFKKVNDIVENLIYLKNQNIKIIKQFVLSYEDCDYDESDKSRNKSVLVIESVSSDCSDETNNTEKSVTPNYSLENEINTIKNLNKSLVKMYRPKKESKFQYRKHYNPEKHESLRSSFSSNLFIKNTKINNNENNRSFITQNTHDNKQKIKFKPLPSRAKLTDKTQGFSLLYKKKSKTSPKITVIPFIFYLTKSENSNKIDNDNSSFLCKTEHEKLNPVGLFDLFNKFSVGSLTESQKSKKSQRFQIFNNYNQYFKLANFFRNSKLIQTPSNYLINSQVRKLKPPVYVDVKVQTPVSNNNQKILSNKNFNQQNTKYVRNIHYHITDDEQNSNSSTTKSIFENTTQYFNLTNEITRRNIANNETTSKNNVTDSV